jgi:hypothetical protein
MANIKINSLSGSDLFNDSESFLVEISDEANEIIGGALPTSLITLGTLLCTRRTQR